MKIISIKRQINTIIYKTFFLPYILLIILSLIIFYFYFNYIERNNSLDVLKRVMIVYEYQYNQYLDYLRDFLDYDGPILYFDNKYPDYIQKEIIYTAQRIDIQLFVSINKDNSIREMVFFDKEGNILKVPKEIENFFTQKNVKHINNINEAITGIIPFNNNTEFLLFYARGVFWFGDDYRKSHGTMVWSRVINDDLLKIYSEFIGFDIKIIPIHLVDRKKLEPLNTYNKYLYNVINKNLLLNEGYIIINDFFNKPAFYFYLNLPKIFFKEYF